jgi:hypothetical protein
MKHSTPLRGEPHQRALGRWLKRGHWRVSLVMVLALALLSGVVLANGSSTAQAATSGTTDPAAESDATVITTTTPATEPTTTEPNAAPTTAEPNEAPTTIPATAGLAASVPCEGFVKNFGFGSNSVTGTVSIGQNGTAVPEHTVTFDVSSTATETCTVYAQIFTYDGPGALPQTAVATSTIVLMPGASKHIELKTSECRVQADLTLKQYETIQPPGMNWDDYIASDTSTCPAPPPCRTSNHTEVQPGYAVPDGDHVLVRSTSASPEKQAFVAYALTGSNAPADNNDLTTIVTNLVLGMDLFGQPVMGTTDNCASVPVPKCRAYAIVEIAASTTPLPRVYLALPLKAVAILSKTGLDLTKLLDFANIDFSVVIDAYSKLSQEDQTALLTELFNQPGLAMNFYSVNWFSVPGCPPDPVPSTPAEDQVAPAQQVGVLAEANTPPQVLPATGTNTNSTVGFALFVMVMGVGLCCLARYRKV